MTALESGFRVGHSTETAVLRVLSDMLESVDGCEVTSLILLDLSAAFDIVDHDILCRRLQSTTFGMNGPLRVAPVLSVGSHSTRAARIVDIVFGQADLRRSAGLDARSDPISDVHCRLVALV